ncbi:MAG: translocation/assembly module TamB domain-containing protein [Acidobacteriota bacterium]|nr:translocation/assembly module TamB domain-containing protein [Acidobacteriota bacterium]
MALGARGRRAIAVGAAGVLAVLALLVGSAHLPFVRARVLNLVLQKIDGYGVVAQADGLDYNLLRLDFRLRGVRLAAPGHTGDPFFTADEIHVDLPWSVVTGPIHLQAIDVTHPRITIVRTAAGSNLPSTVSPGGGGGTLSSLPVDRLSIQDLQASVRDEPDGFDATMTGLSLALAPSGGGIAGPIQMTSPARVAWRGRRSSIDTLEGQLGFDGSTLLLNAVRVMTPEGLVQADGRVSSVFSSPTLALTWKGELNLPPLARLASVDTPVAGRLVMTGSASGAASAPRASIDLNGRGLQLASLHDVSLAARAGLSPQQAEISTLRIDAAGGTLSGGAQLSFGSGGSTDRPGRATFAWHDLDVAPLLALAPGGAPVRLSGTLDGSLDARWTALQPSAVSLALRTDSRAPASSASGLNGSVTLHAADGRWTAAVDQRVGQALHLSGTTGGAVGDTFSRTTLGDASRLVLSVANAGTAWRTARALGLIGSSPPPGVAGAAQATLALHGVLSDPQLDATVVAEGVTAGGLGPIATRATVSASTAAARFDSLTATMAQSSLAASGAIDFTTQKISGTAHATIADLATLGAALPAGLHPSGSLQLDATIGGRLPRPTVEASVTGRDLAAAGQTFAQLTARVGLVHDTVTADPVTLTQADGRLDIHGQYDLGRGTYTLKADGRHLEVSPVPAAAPGAASPAPVHARVDLTIDSHGSITAPEATGRIDATGVSWGSIDLGAAHATLQATGGTLRVDGGLPAFSATGQATVRLQPFGAFTLHANLAPADVTPLLARLPHPPPAPITGSMAAGLTATGDLSRPSGVTATIDLRKLDGTIASMPIHLAAPSSIRYGNRVIDAQPLDLKIGDAALHLSGSLGQPAGDALDARLTGPLSSFNPVVALLETEATGKPATTAIDGRLDLQVHAEGPLDRPAVTAGVNLRDGRVEIAGQPPVTAITVTGSYGDGVLTLPTLSATFQKAELSAKGRVPLGVLAEHVPASYLATLPPAASGPLQLSATFDRLSPELLKPYVSPSTLQQIQGAISGSLEVQADRPTLARTRATLTLQHADLTLGGVPFSQEQPTRLVLENGRLQIASLTWGDTTRSGGNRISLSGSATLTGDRPALDLTANGDLDLRMIGAFASGLTTGGRAQLRAHVGGPLSSPRLDGQIALANGALRYQDPQIAITNLSGTIGLAPDKITIAGLDGEANGGALHVSGDVAYHGTSLGPGRIDLTGRQLALDLKGLRTELDSTLALGINEGQLGLSGSVTVLRGAYRQPFTIAGGLLSILQQEGITVASSGPPSLLDTMTLDVKVSTARDILVDNNYAKLALGLDLQAGGTVAQPGLTGRATIQEGGDIYLGGNTYRISGDSAVDFINPTGIEPDLSVTAKTQVSSYEITLGLDGTLQTLTPTFTSAPQLDQADIVSLLLTGQTMQQGSLAQAAFGSPQVLGYLSGEFLGTAGHAVGLDTLRVQRGLPDVSFDPGLVASETDPSSRLTFGKNVTKDLQLIFSQSLTQSGGLTWIVSWMPRRTIDLRATSLDDGTRRYDFMQELNLFAPKAAATASAGGPAAAERVAEIRFAGVPGEAPATLRGQLKLRTGDTFDFFRWQDDRDRLQRYYQRQGYWEASVQTQRTAVTVPARGDEPARQAVALTYTIEPGPRTTLQIDGYDLPTDVRKQMEQAWTRSVFDQFLLGDLQTIGRAYLAGRGYLRARVDATVAPNANAVSKRIDVQIDPGPRSTRQQIVFTGNRQVTTDQLRELVEDQQLARKAWVDPGALQQAVAALYDRMGMLDTKVRVEPLQFKGTLAELPVAIDEGPLFQIGSVTIDGAHAKPAAVVRQALDLPAGLIYTPASVHDALARVDAAYRQDGFNRERTSVQVTPHAGTGRVDLAVTIDEGPQQVLTGIETSGVAHTNPALVSHALRFKTGEPVNLADWAQARKRLYDTGVFKSVDIQPVPTEMGPPAPNAQGIPTQPVRAKVTLQEWAPLRFRYGFQVQDQQSISGSGRTLRPGLAGDLLYRNLFGRAISTGAAGQFTKDYRAGRAYLTAPGVFGLPGMTSLYLERTHELFNPSAPSTPYITDDTTLSVQQQLRQGRRLSFSYGYAFERNHTFDQHIDPNNPFPFDLTVNIGKLTTTAFYDTRNDLVSPTRGLYTTSSFEYSAPGLASDLNYVKFLAQQRYYRALPKSMVFATSAQVGMARGFGQDIIPSKKFFTGGGNTVRGYALDALGPKDFFGDPTGGDSLLVFNEELRFPLFWIVRGVGFFDAGNVFPTIGDLSLMNLDTSVGFGLRFHTPFALLRIDYGIPLVRTTGMPFGRWYFSIGQAF